MPPSPHHRSFYFPVKDVIDGDLCEQYPQLAAEKQRSVSTHLWCGCSMCRVMLVGRQMGMRRAAAGAIQLACPCPPTQLLSYVLLHLLYLLLPRWPRSWTAAPERC